MSLIEFINEIINSAKTQFWFDSETVVEKNEIYSAYIEFAVRKSSTGKLSTQQFWQKVNPVLCNSEHPKHNTKKKSGKYNHSVRYVKLFPKKLIFNNIKNWNNSDETVDESRNKRNRNEAQLLEKNNGGPKKKQKISDEKLFNENIPSFKKNVALSSLSNNFVNENEDFDGLQNEEDRKSTR